jgi:hypothetical protein
VPARLLDRLDAWKRRFEPAAVARLEKLLAQIAGRRFRDSAESIRLHETLLFLRAYPLTAAVARLADSILLNFAERTAPADAYEEPEVSGIAGTSFCAVFSYEVARRLAALYPRQIEIAWDRHDQADKLGPALARFAPLLEEDWPVEAHVPFERWMAAARRRGASDLGWLLERLAALPVSPRARAEIYDALELPLLWSLGRSPASRSRLRLPASKLFCHSGPLIARRDVSFAAELEAPPLPIRRLSRAEARRILDLILVTSATRYRELYGFSHPDPSAVFHAHAGRGVDVYFFGVPPAWRLPLRAYHAGMFFKNGVPAGYVETLSLFDRAEIGFNLYYTFREGETAWLYARLLRLLHQVLGVNCFSVDPYQIGHENAEAIDSGAFWFYLKLGFRPVEPAIAALTAREERRMARAPGYRSSRRTLEKLAGGYILFEGPAAEPGAWDAFRVRNLGLAAARVMSERFAGDLDRFRRAAALHAARHLGVESDSGLAQLLYLIPDLPRWPAADRAAAAAILAAKSGRSEARYLRLMQRHARLRAALLRLSE